MAAMSWEDQARCRKYDPEMFFAPGGRAERKAKGICGKCTVKTDCLAFALDSRTEFGVWGGLNGKERRGLLSGPTPAGSWRHLLQDEEVAASA
jgi:WhiB family redox-sensing transcriptional regulator